MSNTGKGGKNRSKKKKLGRTIPSSNLNPRDSVGFIKAGLGSSMGGDPVTTALEAIALGYARTFGQVKIADHSQPATALDQERYLKAAEKRNRRNAKRAACQESGSTPSSSKPEQNFISSA